MNKVEVTVKVNTNHGSNLFRQISLPFPPFIDMILELRIGNETETLNVHAVLFYESSGRVVIECDFEDDVLTDHDETYLDLLLRVQEDKQWTFIGDDNKLTFSEAIEELQRGLPKKS